MKKQHAIPIIVVMFLLIVVSASTTSAEKLPEQSVSPRQFKQLLQIAVHPLAIDEQRSGKIRSLEVVENLVERLDRQPR